LDLTPYLEDPSRRPERRDVYLELVDEYRQTQERLIRVPWRGLRSERYLFAATPQRPWMLFDMEEDPYQMNNLLGSAGHENVLEEMAQRLARRVEETEDLFPFDPETALEADEDHPVWSIPWMGD
jgi:hypothetical protein